MCTEKTTSLTLNCEQAHEITIALRERIRYLHRCQDRCRELEIASDKPLFKREYKKMANTYQEWINEVLEVLEYVETETKEIRP